ncbi:low affinity iron permease family protein [Myxococcus stipitatus]|uniref:low affinity iron permease family protein n=1 Tax=Myxococcus stipitatus TaxID=83455 RepID=UPI003144F93D
MHERFHRFAHHVAMVAGSPVTFFVALGGIVGWCLLGPLFSFSDSWQLVINTATTIITFLMVFLIQATQNRDAKALHLKLDELIRAQRRARNTFADLEDATDEELADFEQQFQRLRATWKGRREGAAEEDDDAARADASDSAGPR